MRGIEEERNLIYFKDFLKILLEFYCNSCSKCLNLPICEAIEGVVIFWAGWHSWCFISEQMKSPVDDDPLKSRKDKKKSNPGIFPSNLCCSSDVLSLIHSEQVPHLLKSLIFIILIFLLAGEFGHTCMLFFFCKWAVQAQMSHHITAKCMHYFLTRERSFADSVR